jgi:hypothetical protein
MGKVTHSEKDTLDGRQTRLSDWGGEIGVRGDERPSRPPAAGTTRLLAEHTRLMGIRGRPLSRKRRRVHGEGVDP